MDESSITVAVVGAGSWGTALALHMARRGHRVRLWTRTEEHAEQIRREGSNRRYLPDHPFPEGVEVATDLARAVAGAALVVLAVPSHGLRHLVRKNATALSESTAPILVAAKGVEVDSLATMAEVLDDELGKASVGRTAVLGGPSFAAEVAQGLPTAVVIAARREGCARSVQQMMSGAGIRAYVTEDVVGVELGGAFKNIIAIAAGMCDGAGLGLNARAGLITRGLAEISRLAISLGAIPATLAGLAGLGDLVLTCTGGLSRNRRVGVALGEGRKLEQVVAELGMVAEGVRNTRSAYQLSTREGVEMPITETMHAILYEDLTVAAAVDQLMNRALKPERA